jgi:hypothetical protein
MEDLGIGFSVAANRRRCLKAVAVFLCCVAGLCLICASFRIRVDPWLRFSDILLMIVVLAWACVFAVVAYARWLDGRRA